VSSGLPTLPLPLPWREGAGLGIFEESPVTETAVESVLNADWTSKSTVLGTGLPVLRYDEIECGPGGYGPVEV
jgi:hypothetical protein